MIYRYNFRHKAQKAMHGGRECLGATGESRVCPHEDMEEFKNKNITKGLIYYCPGLTD